MLLTWQSIDNCVGNVHIYIKIISYWCEQLIVYYSLFVWNSSFTTMKKHCDDDDNNDEQIRHNTTDIVSYMIICSFLSMVGCQCAIPVLSERERERDRER